MMRALGVPRSDVVEKTLAVRMGGVGRHVIGDRDESDAIAQHAANVIRLHELRLRPHFRDAEEVHDRSVDSRGSPAVDMGVRVDDGHDGRAESGGLGGVIKPETIGGRGRGVGGERHGSMVGATPRRDHPAIMRTL